MSDWYEKKVWMLKRFILRVQNKRRIALASFPRSGNTWIRFMIEELTNETSGSIYEDRVMPRGKQGIVIKTHDLDSHHYTDCIHIVRNPFDAIESFFHWKRDIIKFKTITWDEHVEQSVNDWTAHTNHWLKALCSRHLVKYEDMKNDTLNELKSLLLWLGYDLSDSQFQEVITKASLHNMRKKEAAYGNQFFRRGEIGKSIESFNETQKEYVIKNTSSLLEQCGYGDFLKKNGLV